MTEFKAKFFGRDPRMPRVDQPGNNGKPPGNNSPESTDLYGDEPERWENPRGVQLMAPLRNITTIRVEDMHTASARIISAMRTVLTEAQRAGIAIIDTSEMSDSQRVVSDETYDVEPSPEFTLEREKELRRMLSKERTLLTPKVQPLVDITYETLRDMLSEQEAFVLARKDLERGKGKYLIDTKHQVAILGRLLDVEDNYSLLDFYDVLEYIPTPSEHYTSYKVVTNPRAEVLAATLVYSRHKKNAFDHVVELPNLQSTDDLKRVLFEYPESEAYLGAKAVMSNSGGGLQIPLMGDYSGTLRPGEAEILEAHGIDPSHPAVPEELLSLVGQLQPLTRLAGLVSSVDFVQHQETRKFYFLEVNAGPGPTTFARCWLGDSEQSNFYEAMYRHSIRSLVGV